MGPLPILSMHVRDNPDPLGGVPMDFLWHAIPCFPRVNEPWVELLEIYRSQTR